MTVREAIQRLAKLDPDLPLYVEDVRNGVTDRASSIFNVDREERDYDAGDVLDETAPRIAVICIG